eukprot:gb/GECH01006602.1/.p1 GENE.gb/GECH01006602.1/~~gb/GECH01006602.1/.p1  ORF type:complete len:832 (+),score=174.80 gb/GECH01006602.1/:1-2496(+)
MLPTTTSLSQNFKQPGKTSPSYTDKNLIQVSVSAPSPSSNGLISKLDLTKAKDVQRQYNELSLDRFASSKRRRKFWEVLLSKKYGMHLKSVIVAQQKRSIQEQRKNKQDSKRPLSLDLNNIDKKQMQSDFSPRPNSQPSEVEKSLEHNSNHENQSGDNTNNTVTIEVSKDEKQDNKNRKKDPDEKNEDKEIKQTIELPSLNFVNVIEFVSTLREIFDKHKEVLQHAPAEYLGLFSRIKQKKPRSLTPLVRKLSNGRNNIEMKVVRFESLKLRLFHRLQDFIDKNLVSDTINDAISAPRYFKTEEELTERDELVVDNNINFQISKWWESCPKNNHSRISREVFTWMESKILKTLAPDTNTTEMCDLIEADWTEDSLGQSSMDYVQFRNSMFRIADAFCETNSSKEFCSFFRMLKKVVFELGSSPPTPRPTTPSSLRSARNRQHPVLSSQSVSNSDMNEMMEFPSPSVSKNSISRLNSSLTNTDSAKYLNRINFPPTASEWAHYASQEKQQNQKSERQHVLYTGSTVNVDIINALGLESEENVSDSNSNANVTKSHTLASTKKSTENGSKEKTTNKTKIRKKKKRKTKHIKNESKSVNQEFPATDSEQTAEPSKDASEEQTNDIESTPTSSGLFVDVGSIKESQPPGYQNSPEGIKTKRDQNLHVKFSGDISNSSSPSNRRTKSERPISASSKSRSNSHHTQRPHTVSHKKTKNSPSSFHRQSSLNSSRSSSRRMHNHQGWHSPKRSISSKFWYEAEKKKQEAKQRNSTPTLETVINDQMQKNAAYGEMPHSYQNLLKFTNEQTAKTVEDMAANSRSPKRKVTIQDNSTPTNK